jgi:hypothetical protein
MPAAGFSGRYSMGGRGDLRITECGKLPVKAGISSGS